MNRATIFLATSLLVGLLAVGLWSGSSLQPPDAHAGATTTPSPPPPVGVQLVAIDTTISGNDDTTIGTIDSCAGDLNVGDTHTFDLVIQGVDDADRIVAYQVDIDYDPDVIAVVSYIDVDAAGSDSPNDVTIISRIPSILGIGFLSLSSVGTNSGSMTMSALDGTAIPAWPDNHESGDGVLARVTIAAVGNGITNLDVGGTRGGLDGFPDVLINSGAVGGVPIPVTSVEDGIIAVGQPCPGPAGTGTPPASVPATSVPAPSLSPIAVELVAIDTTTDGNGDKAIGTIDSCISIANGSSTTFDLIVRGVDDGERIAGFQVDIDYDPAVIMVTSVIAVDAAGSTPPDDVTIISRIASSGGLGLFADINLTLIANSMTLAAFDRTVNPVPPDNHESGDGVLARVTVEAVGDGISLLDVSGPIGGWNGVPELDIASGTRLGYGIPISEVRDGAIAVGQACPKSLPTLTPTPTPTVTLKPATPGVTPSRQSPVFHLPTPTPTPSATPTSSTAGGPVAAGGEPVADPVGLPPTGGHEAAGRNSVGWTLTLLAGMSLLIAGTAGFAAARQSPG